MLNWAEGKCDRGEPRWGYHAPLAPSAQRSAPAASLPDRCPLVNLIWFGCRTLPGHRVLSGDQAGRAAALPALGPQAFVHAQLPRREAGREHPASWSLSESSAEATPPAGPAYTCDGALRSQPQLPRGNRQRLHGAWPCRCADAPQLWYARHSRERQSRGASPSYSYSTLLICCSSAWSAV